MVNEIAITDDYCSYVLTELEKNAQASGYNGGYTSSDTIKAFLGNPKDR